MVPVPVPVLEYTVYFIKDFVDSGAGFGAGADFSGAGAGAVPGAG